jgi:hypothetical protein
VKRLHALRLLKRSSIPSSKLVRVSYTCIRPILEYSCEIWHHSLPQYLSDQIERIQRRVLRIIFPDCCYDIAMDRAGVVSLFIRRETICKIFFERMRILTKHINYIPLSLPIGIQNIPFVVVIRNYQYLGVELIDMQIVS